MACIKSVGKVVALGDAIKSVSTRYSSSNKVQDLKSVEDKIKNQQPNTCYSFVARGFEVLTVPRWGKKRDRVGVGGGILFPRS